MGDKNVSALITFICLAQDGIRAAKRSIQIEIQVAVHKIYQQLSATLERALQANKHHIGKWKPRLQTTSPAYVFNKADLDISGQDSLNYVWHLFLRESSLLAFFCLYFPQVLALLILTLVSVVSLSVLPPTVFHSHPCLWCFKMIFRFFRVK